MSVCVRARVHVRVCWLSPYWSAAFTDAFGVYRSGFLGRIGSRPNGSDNSEPRTKPEMPAFA